MPSEPKAFAANWGYESVETDWRKLVDSHDIDLIDIASPNDTHARNRHRRRQGRQDGDVRKAAGPQSPRKSEAMVEAVEKAGVPNMVWYNYRRVPGRHAGQAVDRRRPPGKNLSLPRQIPAGLDDLERSSAGRRRRCGDWTRALREAASRATCSRTISIRPFG